MIADQHELAAWRQVKHSSFWKDQVKPDGFSDVLEALIAVLPYVESMDDGAYNKGVVAGLEAKIVNALKSAGVKI